MYKNFLLELCQGLEWSPTYQDSFVTHGKFSRIDLTYVLMSLTVFKILVMSPKQF